MTAKQEASVLESTTAVPNQPEVAAAPKDWASCPRLAAVVSQLPGGGETFVARAPGRLDVMGGIAEYSGGLVLNAPIDRWVDVAVQLRDDETLSIGLVGSEGATPASEATVPLDRVFLSGGPIDSAKGRSVVDGAASGVARGVVGVLVEMVRSRLVKDVGGGVSVAVSSTLEGLSDVGRDAAVAAASVVAIARAFNIVLDPPVAAELCQAVENHWIGAPVGIADAMCALTGERDRVARLRCQPCTLIGSSRLPDGVKLVGIDCGVRHATASQKYTNVRTATFMGRALIECIIAHERYDSLQWNGYVSGLSVNDYVARFRDRIPTKMMGGAFLDRFGETADPLTRVDPKGVYKVRSRTEHHVYENARAHRFAECLARADRTQDAKALTDAGELMYASHWSYGQRCGLGSIETDLIVNLAKGCASDAGIFGAKVTGRGCGGVVAVLMRNTDAARAAVNEMVETYQNKSGRTATLLTGSTSGAIVSGARKIGQPAA